MKKRLLATLLITSFSLLSASDATFAKADAMAEDKCGACHVIFTMSKSKFNEMKAPPFWAIAKKVKNAYPNRLEGIEFIKEYTINPDKEKMIFPEQTFTHFGLMPSQKSKVSDEELQLIAEYMVDK